MWVPLTARVSVMVDLGGGRATEGHFRVEAPNEELLQELLQEVAVERVGALASDAFDRARAMKAVAAAHAQAPAPAADECRDPAPAVDDV